MRLDAWTREQLIVALNLYWKIPYNKISGSSNQMIKDVAPLIGRTPAALAYKLMNFTSLDPERRDKGNKGKSSASETDKVIWKEYFGAWDKLALDSMAILVQKDHKLIEEIVKNEESFEHLDGKERAQIVNVRVNQRDFRQRILASYNHKCCITGIDIPDLLIASHIIPWAKNKEERLNPRNGLCLNAIHDRAFDRGLITIANDFTIKLSDAILSKRKDESLQKYFFAYENKKIILPDRFTPSTDFLAYHQISIFNK